MRRLRTLTTTAAWALLVAVASAYQLPDWEQTLATTAAFKTADSSTTTAAHDAERQKIWQVQFVDAYNKVGHRDAKWDKQAIAALQGLISQPRLVNPRQAGSYTDATVVTAVEANAAKAVAAGCKDPAVLFALAASRRRLQQPVAARAPVQLAFEQLPKQPYGGMFELRLRTLHYFVSVAADDLEPQMKGDAFELYKTRLWNERDQAVPSVVNDKSYAGHTEHLLADLTNVGSELQGTRFWQRLAEAAAGAPQPDADWLHQVAQGRYHLLAAWAARGSGWASTVTPEGWRVFGEELTKGAAVLKAAHQKYPDRPWAARQLIVVAMTGSVPDVGTPEAWLQKALDARIDYRPAHKAYAYNLRPRWSGSYAELMQAAAACLKSKRYDTRLPWQSLVYLRELADDYGLPREVWSHPGVFPAMKSMIEAYNDDGPIAKQRRYTALASIAYHAGKMDEAAKAVAAIDSELDSTMLIRLEVGRTKLLNAVLMHNSPNASGLEKARALARAGSHKQALDAYHKLLRAAPAAEIRQIVEAGIHNLHQQAAFDEGETIDFLPPPGIGGWREEEDGWTAEAGAGEWRRLSGKWQLDDNGHLKGVPTKRLTMLSPLKVGPRFEISVSAKLTAKLYSSSNFGVHFYRQRSADGTTWERSSAIVSPTGSWGTFFDGYAWTPQNVRPITPTNQREASFRVVCINGLASLYVGDELIYGNRPIAQLLPHESLQVGIGANAHSAHNAVTFTKLKIRKLPPDDPLVVRSTQMANTREQLVDKVAAAKSQPLDPGTIKTLQALRDKHNWPAWQQLQEPTVSAKDNKNAPEMLPDQSWHFPRPAPNHDVYTFEGIYPAAELAALRLEILPHENAPKGSLGYSSAGFFIVTGVTLEVMDGDAYRPVPLTKGAMNYRCKQEAWNGDGLLQPTDKTNGWTNKFMNLRKHKRAVAVLQPAAPVVIKPGTKVRVRVLQEAKWPRQLAARVRTSFATSGDHDLADFEAPPNGVLRALATYPELSTADRDQLVAWGKEIGNVAFPNLDNQQAAAKELAQLNMVLYDQKRAEVDRLLRSDDYPAAADVARDLLDDAFTSAAAKPFLNGIITAAKVHSKVVAAGKYYDPLEVIPDLDDWLKSDAKSDWQLADGELTLTTDVLGTEYLSPPIYFHGDFTVHCEIWATGNRGNAALTLIAGVDDRNLGLTTVGKYPGNYWFRGHQILHSPIRHQVHARPVKLIHRRKGTYYQTWYDGKLIHSNTDPPLGPVRIGFGIGAASHTKAVTERTLHLRNLKFVNDELPDPPKPKTEAELFDEF